MSFRKPMIINTVYLIGRIWNTVIISLSLRALYTVHSTHDIYSCSYRDYTAANVKGFYGIYIRVRVYIHICITLTWILTKFIHSYSYPLPDRLK